MRYLITLLVLTSSTFLIAQELNFRNYSNEYSEIFETAEEEGKLVMLYFHFDQCGACREMERTAFVDESVAEFFNQNFISFEINTREKKGVEINKIYNIRSHPAFIFLDVNGNELNKIYGIFTPEKFIAQAKNALDPLKTLAFYHERYNSGDRDSDFMYDYCYRLEDANSLDSLVINEYLNTQNPNELSSEENIRFIYEFMINNHKVCIGYSSEAYHFMLDNKDLFIQYFDLDQVETRLMFVISGSVYSAIGNKDATEFWKQLELLKEFDGKNYEFKEIWGGVTRWTTSTDLSQVAQINFYESIGNKEKFHELYQIKIDNMWDDSEALNEFAWNTYLFRDSEFVINKAIECVLRSIQLDSNYNNADTYASLLYKSGDFEKALEEARRAIEIAKAEGRYYTETSDLIKKIKTDR
jgi:thioredoxin-related protein